MAAIDKENKRVLLGKTKILNDGRLSTLEDGDYIMPRGIADGAGAVRFLGVARRARVLESKLSEWKLKEAVRTAMQNVGRGLVLQEEPEAIACLLRYVLTRPAVLCFFYQDEQPVLAAYSGRGLTGWISRLRAVAALKKQLPDTIEISEVTPPDLRKEEKAQKKQEKAAAREAKKQEKAEKKAKKEARKAREEAEKGKEETRTAEEEAEKGKEETQTAAEEELNELKHESDQEGN